MNIEELKNYLSSQCNRVLSTSKKNNLSESDFKNYLEEPLKKFNEKFEDLKTTVDFQEKLKSEIKEIIANFTTELTKIYLSQSLKSL